METEISTGSGINTVTTDPALLVLPLTADRLKRYCYSRIEQLYQRSKMTPQDREMVLGGMDELRALANAIDAAEKTETP